MAGLCRPAVKLLVVLAVLISVAGCGGVEGFDPSEEFYIESPDEGARVTVPFVVELSSDVPLGQPGQAHYVQVFYDGLEGPIATDETFRVTELSVEGPHAIHVTLRNPNGTIAGGEDEIAVIVTGAGNA